MPRLQLPALLLALGLCVTAPAGAQAAFFPGETVDGPSADIVGVGGSDVARDGGAAIVYVKKVAGIDHIFAARMVNGAWQPPERLDPGLPLPSGEPVVGVAADGQAVVAFTNNGQLYTIVRRAKDTTWPGPVATGAPGAATPSIDLSVNGAGYVVWTAGGDVRTAAVARTARTFVAFAEPLDISAAADAGTGTGRPVVATSADGTALAAWGEAGKVYARRLLRTRLSAHPQELGVADLGGHAGGVADLPDVGIADDSSFAWVAFRQAFDAGATTRVLVRRLVGSIFDPPADIGVGGFGGEATTSPALDVAGVGDAIFAAEGATSHTPFGALNYIDSLRAPFAMSGANTIAATPTLAISDTSQAMAAWFKPLPGGVGLVGRTFKRAEPVEAETPLSDPALGSVDPAAGLSAATDKYGDAVIPYVQGVAGTRRVMAAVWDRPPVYLLQTTTYRWRTDEAPVGWLPVSEPWGGIVYTVLLDGRVIGTTTDKRSFPIKGRVSDGRHRWSLVAVDRRGQRHTVGPRSLRIDTTGPSVRVSIRGARRAGNPLRFVVHTADRHAGVRAVRLDLGGTRVFGSDVRHAFARGTHQVAVTATDKAGNARTIRRQLVVK